MKRDFSEQQKQNLLNMVAEVQPDGVFQNLKDWFDDTLLSILNNRYGILGYTKYLSDLDFYHRCMIDKDDVSADKINEIFSNSLGVERNYKIYLQGNLVSISLYSNLLRQYYSCISVDNPSFSSKSAVGTIQQNELYDGYRSLYIKNYQYAHKDYKTSENGKSDYINVFEAVYPEHKEHMNTFFEPMGEQYKTDIDNMKFIVYSADEPYRSLFLDNVEGVSLSITGDGSFYSNSTIFFNWTNSAKTTSDPRGDYAGFFHEFGHYLDDKFKPDGGFLTGDFKTTGNITLQASIDKDVDTVVKNKIKEMYPDYDDTTVDQICARITNGNLPGYVDNDSQKVINASKKVQKKLSKELSSALAGGVSDAYDSSTNYLWESTNQGCIIPSEYYSSKTGKGVAGAWQHDNDYYYSFVINQSKGKQIMIVTQKDTSHSGAAEGFATYYSNKICGWNDYSTYYDKYLPETKDYYGEVIKYMTSR